MAVLYYHSLTKHYLGRMAKPRVRLKFLDLERRSNVSIHTKPQLHQSRLPKYILVDIHQAHVSHKEQSHPQNNTTKTKSSQCRPVPESAHPVCQIIPCFLLPTWNKWGSKQAPLSTLSVELTNQTTQLLTLHLSR